MSENDPSTYRSEPCPPCPAYWVATRTYVAECPAGSTGAAVSVTRQARSTLSLEHANTLALDLAKKEAEREIVCTFTATRCARPDCSGRIYDPICATETSTVSQAAAITQALNTAIAAAQAFCAGG